MRKVVREYQRAYTAVAEEYGCFVHPPIQNGNSHYQWVVEHPSGLRRKIHSSGSPSDHRALKNQLTLLKKICRQLLEESRSIV